MHSFSAHLMQWRQFPDWKESMESRGSYVKALRLNANPTRKSVKHCSNNIRDWKDLVAEAWGAFVTDIIFMEPLDYYQTNYQELSAQPFHK